MMEKDMLSDAKAGVRIGVRVWTVFLSIAIPIVVVAAAIYGGWAAYDKAPLKCEDVETVNILGGADRYRQWRREPISKALGLSEFDDAKFIPPAACQDRPGYVCCPASYSWDTDNRACRLISSFRRSFVP
jgi:hypothetical protein